MSPSTEHRPSSRRSREAAGWTCQLPADPLLEATRRPSFSWFSPNALWRSRNDVLTRIADSTNDERRRWVELLHARGRNDTLSIDRCDLDSVSFLIFGDPGEGDASQAALIEPLLEVGADTDFALIASDVIYPAGDSRDYLENFYRPYKDYPAPIVAVPGNHDWYDGLQGFMLHFCGVARDPSGGSRMPSSLRRRLARALWRTPPPPDPADRLGGSSRRPSPEQDQPGPYFVLDTGPLRIVGIDTGISGELDRQQGEWLRRVSRDSGKPKLLLSGKPIYVDATYQPGPIEGGGTVDEIVREPKHRYIAVVGGDIHNYQRYPVRVEEGRTIQYMVSGGGGAFMHATHKIPRVQLPGTNEKDFRCYPLRGDSLSFYSLLYDRKLAGGHGRLYITPCEAARLMARRLGLRPVREDDCPDEITPRAERAMARVFPLPGRARGPWHHVFSEFFDWNEPPLFKNFLRIDAEKGHLRLRCFGVTGCREHARAPHVEDEFSVDLATGEGR